MLEATSQEGWVVQGGLVWGQDELGVVQDLVAGWREEEESRIVANVSTTHLLGNVKAMPASKVNEDEEVGGAAPAKPML